MNIKMNSMLLGTLLMTATTASCAVDLDLSTDTQGTHSWGGYHWARTSNPFALTIGDSVSGPWDAVLQTTSADWSASTMLDTHVVASSSAPRRCKAIAGRVEVCNTTYGNNGWLGVASISITGGTHITAATVKLNDTYFNKPAYNTTAWRNLVSCQEVGHAFGLDHQDEAFDNPNLGTCMDYTSDPSSNQHPNQHDIDMLQQIYAHLDSTTTIGATTPSSVHADEGNWGTLVDSHGHNETYVRDHGNGDLTVTHVFWADE